MWKWLLFLLSIFSPQVDGDGNSGSGSDDSGDSGNGGSDPGDADPADDDPTDDDPDEEGDEPDAPAPRESRAQKEIRTLRERAQAAETAHARAMAELDVARRAPAGPAHVTEDQRLFQQEEEVLRNPETTDWQRYAINAARGSRAAAATSNAALQRAEELADQSNFNQLKLTKPKLFEKYSGRVEEKLKDMRRNGSNAPREGILAILIGQDLLAGKLETKTEAKPNKVGAKRGSLPGARSDTSSSGSRLTEAEKRYKRLENVRI